MLNLDLLTRQEARKNFRLSEGSFDRLVKSGTVPHVQLGRRKLFRASSLEQFLERSESVAGQPIKIRG